MPAKYYNESVKKSLMKYRGDHTEEYKLYMKTFMKQYREKNRDKYLLSLDKTRIKNNSNYEVKTFFRNLDPFLFFY